MKSDKKIKKINKILNHKSKEQMYNVYRNAEKLDEETRTKINEIVDKCEICKRNSRSNSEPSVAISKATVFNSTVAIDLKVIGDKYIFWMVCACTRFIKGRVLKDKNPESIMEALHRGWCLPYGYPTAGFWCDNGGEFRNSKMEEYVNKLGIKIKFIPAYLPWSNGVNERNHYNCDVIVKKIMDEDKKVSLGEAVEMASWTHNTNVNVLGFQLLQLVTGKSVTIPGLKIGDMATDLMYDDEMIRNTMKPYYMIMKEFRELEYFKKLRKAFMTRMKEYEDVKIDA